MKAAILHLSDIHIEHSNAKWLIDKTEKIVSSIWNDFSECDKIIIVVSGDVVYSGKKQQYEEAKRFFSSLLRCFAERPLRGIELENRIICVPGNHDCNFDQENATRTMLLSIVKSNVDSVDDSVYSTLSSIQNEYRDFAKERVGKDISVRFNDDIEIKVGDKTILFRLYNTAWMSTIKEEQNSIAIPMKWVNPESHDANLVISVFHHYYSWMSPAADDSRNRFRKYVMRTSNVVLYGHEHIPAASQVKDNYEGESINEFEGGALYSSGSGSQRESSFNTLMINFDSFECIVKSFHYESGIYVKKKEEVINLDRERKMDEFRHNSEFLSSLKRMSIPIYNSENGNMTLDEFFVYPDLERINSRQVRVDEDYVDSSALINDRKYELTVLEGDDQCGKTSLLNMLYLQYVEKYLYPILIEGKNLINENIV